MMRKVFILASALAIVAIACQDVDLNGDDEPEAAATVTPEDDGETADGEETPTGCAEVSSPEGAPAPVSMRDTFFEPNCLAVSSTQTFTLTNTGDLLHNFSIRGSDVDIDIQPDEEEETEQILSEIELGTHEFFCKYHEDQGMVGVVTIE